MSRYLVPTLLESCAIYLSIRLTIFLGNPIMPWGGGARSIFNLVISPQRFAPFPMRPSNQVYHLLLEFLSYVITLQCWYHKCQLSNRMVPKASEWQWHGFKISKKKLNQLATCHCSFHLHDKIIWLIILTLQK